jgi:hypothetical protein
MSADDPFLEPWYALEGEGQAGLQVTPRHILFGKAVTIIARRADTDDALFLLEDGSVAEVQLTWSEHAEADPSFPWTTLYPSLQAWVEQSMIPAHRNYVE